MVSQTVSWLIFVQLTRNKYDISNIYFASESSLISTNRVKQPCIWTEQWRHYISSLQSNSIRKLGGFIIWNAHSTVFGWKRSVICAQAAYLLHSTMISDWVMLTLFALLLVFSFQFSLVFFHVGQPGSTAAYLVYPISDIRRCRKCG